jgi:hypothetical protein
MMKKLILTLFIIFFGVTALTAQTVDVTFKVDMSVQMGLEKFNPATDTVKLRGSFDGWGAGAVMTDNNDSIYVVTVTGQPQNTVISYKFFHTGSGGTWEGDPNREINTGTGSTLELDPYFFDVRTPNTGVAANVTFNVDMRLPLRGEMELGDTVFIAGNFTDWGTGRIAMEGPDPDSVYTVTVNTFTSGDLAIYKFIWSNGAMTWESPTGFDVMPSSGNRIYGVFDGDNTVDRLWNNEDPTVQLGDGSIIFVVDMSVPHELGIFDPSVDSVQIRGEFNGWNDSDPARSLMNRNPNDEDIWFLDVSLQGYPINGDLKYKFFIKNDPGSTPYANTGWEVPVGTNVVTGDRNRAMTFYGIEDQQTAPSWFENIHEDMVIPDGMTVETKFSVDMTGAPGFNQATDTVYWMPWQPLFYSNHGLEWTPDNIRYLAMTNTSGMIYEGTLTLVGPAFNGFLYRYGFANGTTFTFEEGSQLDGRVRYITQTGPREFTQPYDMPLDVWTDGEKPEEEPPVSVKEIKSGIPASYSLEQNYPNPFNPSTTIRFSIPEAGLVSLSIYNVIGEKVGEMLNSEMNAGTYEYTFDASKYSSGVYFYSIKSGNFVQTKKMMLLK